MHLVEVLIAAGLLAAVCLSLPIAYTGAARANRAAADVTWTAVLAAQKVEELRSAAFPPADAVEWSELLDADGRAIEDPRIGPVFVRTWRTEALASAPDDTVVITVVVTPYRRAVAAGIDVRTAGATRLVTLRTRKSL
jgi:Tfp pilus assembly protein PilV